MRRAYSRIELKSISDERRTFAGVASTPTPDRMGDVVEPAGAKYELPIPLLWQHQSDQPIGHITEARATKNGIVIRGEVFKASESKTLMDRLDEAWESLKLGLVRGLSIGFSAIEAEMLKDRSGIHFKQWDWHELSAVTIPANVEASITTIKSLDRDLMAASGRKGNVVWLGDSGATARRKSVVYLNKRLEP